MQPAQASTSANITSCRWCGLTSSTIPHTIESCPLVKAVEYHPDGSLARVEKFGPQDASVAPVTPLWWYSSHYTDPTAPGQHWPSPAVVVGPLAPAHSSSVE